MNMSRELKIEAARAALEYVKDGMKLGIGTGSTAEEFIRLLAERVKGGLDIIGVPTSERSRELCEELGIKLATLEEQPELDLTIDGADEVDGELSLIKGGGGALLREKIVAAASKSMVVIVDRSKMVETLGAFDLPIEVNEFGLAATIKAIENVTGAMEIDCPLSIRGGKNDPFYTDGGHLIIDAKFGRILDARTLSRMLLEIPGVVQHGLFIDMASVIVVASKDGNEVITN
ncbi:MAG: ribose-5-phosphate isomerase RpiA [Rhizobiales bacterium]|nr:ribose-5-phosphate isomerase RpiA [Hyphomicrobiales bacterium]